MKLFSLLYHDDIHLSPGKKVLQPEEYSAILSAEELLKKMHEELDQKKKEEAELAAKAKAKAQEEGFQEGLKKWADQLAQFEKSLAVIKAETEKNVVPIAIKAAKKIVGHEIEIKPETLIDIVKQSLKSVAQHRKFSLFVNPQDLEFFEAHRKELKAELERAESLTISPRENVTPGACTIETEAGIINVNLEELWTALETAFQQLLQS